LGVLILNNFKILCIGHDPATLQVRSAGLVSAGHQVKVVRPYWALILLRKDYYDAVILCHTLAKWEGRLLSFQIESLGRKTPVFQLCSSVQGTTFQHVTPCGQSEELLMAVVSALENRPDAA
jgi:DNA-binding response OmpR family regulator